MTKLFMSVFVFLFIFLVNPGVSYGASLFMVKNDGSVERNVLGESIDLKTAVEKVSKKVASAALEGVKEIAITEIENKAHIRIEMPPLSEDQVLGASLKDLIDVEGSVPSEKIAVTKAESGFGISQHGVTATTILPVSVIPSSQEVYLQGQGGKVKLRVMPSEAVATVVRANVMNIMPEYGSVTVEDGEHLRYKIVGERSVRILNLTKIIVPVTSYVSIETGEIASVDQPRWLSILGFLFS